VTAELARAGGPLAAAGLALLLVAARRDLRVGGLVSLALGGVMLAVYLAPEGHDAALAAAAVAGIAVAVGLAVVFHRRPWLLAVAALACTPIRIPVSLGDTEASLLLPLYGVIAGAGLALGWQLLANDGRSRELGPVAWPLAAFIAWSGLSLLWTDDLREGSIELVFFYLPFGLLAIALVRLPWSRRFLTILYAQLAVMALAFAAIGVYQWVTRDVFWNPKVIVGNAYLPFYRVNSVFWDPSIYGRFLVVAILVSLALVVHGARIRIALAATAAIAALWVGLLFSFSQSSFVALAGGVLVAGAVAWRWRAAAAAGLAGAVLVTVGFSAPQVRNTLLGTSSTSLDKATSGRAKLISNGVEIALEHPAGVGIGGFKRAYAKEVGSRVRNPRAVSHNTPVTVAAETGAPGFILLAWLAGAAFATIFRRLPYTFAGRTVLAVGLALAAIAVHSLFYDAFFEDPLTWGLLALGVLAAGQIRREEASA
jgi:putative inorganic carbon (HCO3(-)) transporter